MDDEPGDVDGVDDHDGVEGAQEVDVDVELLEDEVTRV